MKNINCRALFLVPLAHHLIASISAFTFTSASIRRTRNLNFVNSPFCLKSSAFSASDLLYQDQQQALLRRALVEQELLSRKGGCKELKAKKCKAKPAKPGTGFGGGKGSSNAKASDPRVRLAVEQAKVIQKDGLLRINNALSPDLADKLREYVLQQQKLSVIATTENPAASKAFYGVENQRKSRCDLQLSLMRGGYAVDNMDINDALSSSDANANISAEGHVLADALQELLGANGTLRYLYENLVTLDGELYELGAVITNKGSKRQTIHPDLPYKPIAPLYVIFLALQDVTTAMGPTTFLLGTHTKKANEAFDDKSRQDELYSNADCCLSTLKKGDVVLFDARVLHCGNANDEKDGATRVMFNFSFRNPAVTGDLGYEGSIRPDYVKAMNLQDVSNALISYGEGNMDPFAKYGDGLKVRY